MLSDSTVCLDHLDPIVAGESDLETILRRLILGKVKHAKSIIDNGIPTCCDNYCDTCTIRELRSL